MKHFLLFLLLLNILYCQKDKLLEIKKQIEKTNIKNIKNYPLTTLGYITPWNKEGYDYVEKYANKFDIVSPTWFNLKPEEVDGELQIILDGSNNIDSSYIKRLKNNNPNILILPRLYASFNDDFIYKIWFTKELLQFKKVLERRLKYNKFDGFVFDCMAIWYKEEILDIFIKKFLPEMKNLMQKYDKKFIITMIPKNEMDNSILTKEKFKEIANNVDYINIMTYDYQQYTKNRHTIQLGPISWIKETINFYVDKNDNNKDKLLQKILFGLPFHGIFYDKNNSEKSGVINCKGFFENLEQNDEYKIIFDENEYEYNLKSENDKIIAYPFIPFIEKRLELSKELKLGGCGIWDIGNGKEGLLEPL